MDSVSFNIEDSTDSDGDGDDNINDKIKNNSGDDSDDYISQVDVHSEQSSVDSMKDESLPDRLLQIL